MRIPSDCGFDYPFDLQAASYIEEPVSDTVMFIGKKLEKHLSNLNTVENCLVFIDRQIEISKQLQERHHFVPAENPAWEYAKVAALIKQERAAEQKELKYTMTANGYWLGERGDLGENVLIEPGAMIGHGVVIGDNTLVLSGSCIKNARIGANCIIKAGAIIGGQGFTMAKDEHGNNSVIYSLGKVQIGDCVQIGSCTTIDAGSAGDTRIGNNTKIDNHVHIGHDVICGRNVTLTSGVTIGGYCRIGDNAYLGVGSTVKNRLKLGADSFVAMGSVVIRNVKDNIAVCGNPAKAYERL